MNSASDENSTNFCLIIFEQSHHIAAITLRHWSVSSIPLFESTLTWLTSGNGSFFVFDLLHIGRLLSSVFSRKTGEESFVTWLLRYSEASAWTKYGARVDKGNRLISLGYIGFSLRNQQKCGWRESLCDGLFRLESGSKLWKAIWRTTQRDTLQYLEIHLCVDCDIVPFFPKSRQSRSDTRSDTPLADKCSQIHPVPT